MKNSFKSKSFAAKSFASGMWWGIGVDVSAITPTGLDYHMADNRPHYKISDQRPHYKTDDNRLFVKATKHGN